MQTIEQLNQKFGINQVAKFEPGPGGLTRLGITAPGGSAQIYLHGAHVAQFQPTGQPPVMFVASKAFFEAGKAIRGGVPLVFPWFGPRDGDKSAMHGFVRTRTWTVDEVKQVGDAVRAVFSFASSPETRAIWNHDFAARFIVTAGKTLTMETEVRNTSAAEFRFEEMLHTYFNVGDVRKISVAGLTGATYVDKNNLGPEHRTDSDNPLRFKGPTDRVYIDSAATCVIEDEVLRRHITVAKENSNSTVVWNPWSDKIGTFVDMTSEEWVKFVCVESCNVWDHAITLAPGKDPR